MARARLSEGWAFRELGQPKEANAAVGQAKRVYQETGDRITGLNVALVAARVRTASDEGTAVTEAVDSLGRLHNYHYYCYPGSIAEPTWSNPTILLRLFRSRSL